jgi:mannose-6-phosphate isomerase-like protein (cupin superfamily)
MAARGVMAASPKPARGARGFERRPWGGFQTLVTGVGYKVKRLVVHPGTGSASSATASAPSTGWSSPARRAS